MWFDEPPPLCESATRVLEELLLEFDPDELLTEDDEREADFSDPGERLDDWSEELVAFDAWEDEEFPDEDDVLVEDDWFDDEVLSSAEAMPAETVRPAATMAVATAARRMMGMDELLGSTLLYDSPRSFGHPEFT